MRTLAFLLISLTATQAADPKLEALLQQIAKYDYDQGRQPLLDLETVIRNAPTAEVEKRFIEFLRSPSTIAGKDFICRQLSLIGTDASVPQLASMLTEPPTSEMARYALERIPGAAATSALRDALDKAPEKSRPGIVNTLAIRRDSQAVSAIEKLTASQDKVLAESAIAALGRIASPRALAVLAGLRKQGSVLAMEASLVAADSLASPDRKSSFAIYSELNSNDAPVMIRIGALNGLARTQGAEAVPQLLAAMRGSDAKIQAAAIRAMTPLQGPGITRALADELPKLSPASRVRAITALGARGDRTALAAIAKAARDESEEVRIAAYAALSAIGDASSIPALSETAASTSAGDAERTAARAAVDRMRGKEADQAIVAAIASSPTPVKIELIRASGERGIAEAAPALLQAVRDADRNVRRESFRALRETAGSSEVPALLELLSASTTPADRREIERALSAALRRSPAARSSDVAAAYQASQNAEVRASLLQVMGQAGTKEVLPVLRSAMNGGAPDLVRAALLGLTEWPDEEPMRELLAFSGKTQNAAHQILALRGFLKLIDLPSTRPPVESARLLAEAMKLARQAEEKKAILALLPRFPSKESLLLAESAASDSEVASEAKMAVQRLQRSLR